MDRIREDKLAYHRHIEKMIKGIEVNEAKANEAVEAIHRKSELNKGNIGPANELLRFLYILEQQSQSDTDEIRMKAREDVYEYMDQFRQFDDDELGESETIALADLQNTAVLQPPTVVPHSSAVVSQPPTVAPQPSAAMFQPSTVASQPPTVVLQSSTRLVQPPTVVPQPPAVIYQQDTTIPQPSIAISQPPTVIASVTDPIFITQETLIRYQSLLSDAKQYEIRYTKVDPARKKQLASRLKETMNKLRQDTYETLKSELFEFLNGQEQKVSNQNIRILNEEERLLCLSMLASLVLLQLLGSDLTSIKAEIFIPLIVDLCENQKYKEFCTIFLERLYKKCPYTVPSYPKRLEGLSDEQYRIKLGYVIKQGDDQQRLETETEFLNRMSGFIRLFCQLLVRGGLPFDKNLSIAWRWFADVLNLPPQPNITAVLLRIFLDEAGNAMMKQYPTQFPKLTQAIEKGLDGTLKNQMSDDQLVRLRLILAKFRSKS